MKLHSTATKAEEKAILVALVRDNQTLKVTLEYLDELEFLAKTLNIKTIKSFYQKLSKPDKKSFVGKGKLEEINTFLKDQGIEIVIFDDDLSPSQLRNLEKALQVKIYDRSLLILDIFLKRAQTSQAKTQVELARYQYLMPRLTRMWTHLERQRGGTGTRGGAGEKEIETDRRNIRNQISVLKKKLDKINLQGSIRRKTRNNIVRISLVGYTNVGKSTIMKVLTKEKNLLAKNELFATVDSTVRKVVHKNIPYLISDTVGFIRKLPHDLIESFKSTLDEIREADILLHVVDVSHPSFEEQINVVNSTLADIGAADKEVILIYNKIDKLSKVVDDDDQNDFTVNLKESNSSSKIFISAANNENIEDFKNLVFEKVKQKHLKIYPNYLTPDYY